MKEDKTSAALIDRKTLMTGRRQASSRGSTFGLRHRLGYILDFIGVVSPSSRPPPLALSRRFTEVHFARENACRAESAPHASTKWEGGFGKLRLAPRTITSSKAFKTRLGRTVAKQAHGNHTGGHVAEVGLDKLSPPLQSAPKLRPTSTLGRREQSV